MSGMFIFSSVVGRVNTSAATVASASEAVSVTETNRAKKVKLNLPDNPIQIKMISVLPKDGCFRAIQQVICPGQTVLGRVSRILATQQQVMIDIVANPYGVLDSIASGTIRREDISKKPIVQPSIPLLQLSHSFHVGDWVVAKVLSLGEDSNRTSRYWLTTAESSSLGVISAICAQSGETMIPRSWNEMECPVTRTVETRKCARPPRIPVQCKPKIDT
jgi:exosome complex RNA-binding protein Csl4